MYVWYTSLNTIYTSTCIEGEIGTFQCMCWDTLIQPAACDVGNLRICAFEENVLLVIDDVNTSPVHGDDDIVLRQAWSRESIRFEELGEQERPFHFGVEYQSLLHVSSVHVFLGIRSLGKVINSKQQ